MSGHIKFGTINLPRDHPEEQDAIRISFRVKKNTQQEGKYRENILFFFSCSKIHLKVYTRENILN